MCGWEMISGWGTRTSLQAGNQTAAKSSQAARTACCIRCPPYTTTHHPLRARTCHAQLLALLRLLARQHAGLLAARLPGLRQPQALLLHHLLAGGGAAAAQAWGLHPRLLRLLGRCLAHQLRSHSRLHQAREHTGCKASGVQRRRSGCAQARGLVL